MQKHRALTLARLGRFQEQWQKDGYAQRAAVTLSANPIGLLKPTATSNSKSLKVAHTVICSFATL
jgi:hypothetical protein